MTWTIPTRSGPVPAPGSGKHGLGRGERETRGEHRGRGERLPSGSRFVFPVPAVLLVLLAALAAPASAQEAARTGWSLGVRGAGLYSTQLFADAIGYSIIPDTVTARRFSRDSVTMRMGVAPDVSLFASLPLAEETELELAAGYTFARLDVSSGEAVRDAGSIAVGHAVLGVRKPVRGFLARGGIGAMWFHGADVTAVREMRTLNPVIEAGVARRWLRAGFDLEAGLVAQAVQVSSAALTQRQGPAGMVYRVGIELGVARSFDR